MLNTLTLKQALDKLEKKEITLGDLNSDVKSAIEKLNKDLNVYLTINEKKITQAEMSAPLAGLPIAVKDNYCTKDLKTTASSTVLDNFIPQYDSTVIAKLKKAGGHIVGKTNLDAWAHGSSTETSQYGRTLNPRNTDYLPGGSSGGSAAAVAADLCLASLGTETAGSIRQPSSWCGVVGLKPTYGRCSRYGVVAMASSTDSPGPIAKTVEDSAILLNYIAGHDKYDGTTSTQKVEDYTKYLDQNITGMKIGVLYTDIEGLEEIKEIFIDQVKVFEKLGATVEFIKAMDPHHAIGVYTIIQRGEVSSNLGRFDGIRYGNDRSFFGHEAKNRIMLGTYTLSKGYAHQYYNTAQKVRTLFIEDYKKLFKDYDVLVSPTSPGYAKKIGISESSAMFGELEDMLLEPSSIAGLPGISVPCYRDPKTNLYLGMNLVAPMFREDLVIKVGDAFEKNTKWNSWRNK
ncbi:MAG: Asp-tRNA(Asn)/Glu-tRNA(Gln) amidotransferase subunit GatA [Candidatus Pacebacteria bacterium]|nr:Asp-tRNA(Asn)/Glu-tRNA(Gln) amidotransferase subunit GatA [Candidatus Paceibacterota bacterium]